MTRKRQSRATGRKVGKIWTANVFSELDALATVISVNLVEEQDIAPFAHLMMQTVRGWIHVAPLTGSVLDDTIFMAIVVVDEDVASTSASMLPTAADFYVDEDILWTGGAVTTHGVGTVVGGGGHWFDINLKTKRRIRDGQDLRFVFANLDGTGEQIVSGVLRTLLHSS